MSTRLDSDANSRLIPMQCGDDESYVLHFYDVTDDDGNISVQLDIYEADKPSTVYQSLSSPFPAGSEREIRYVQSFDVMFFAQGETYPCKLSREENTSTSSSSNEYFFSFSDVDFVVEPLMEWEISSEHVLRVFPQPDEDLLSGFSDDETPYYSAGDVRAVTYTSTLEFAYSYRTITADRDEDGDSRPSFSGYITTMTDTSIMAGVRAKLYAVAISDDAGSFDEGQRITFDSGSITLNLVVKYQYNLAYSYVYTQDGAVAASNTEEATGSGASHSYSGVSFTSGVISKISDTSIYLHIATIEWFSTNSTGDYSVSITDTGSVGTTVATYSDPEMYVCLSDQTDTTISVTDERYYKLFSGVGSNLCLTIDGANTADNVDVGMMLAIKYKNRIYESTLWDYDTYPVDDNTVIASSPEVEVEDPLDSKLDANDNELRPTSGGGYGFASNWIPVRGEITLKTEGVWSGIIELQELDEDGDVYTIGKISSENGLSNTELTREITEFGHSVRVACTRREYAYQTQASINSNFTLRYIIVKADDGCQWTLTSTDIQTVFLRITGTKTLSDGQEVYLVDVLSGASSSVSSDTYALGAWSTQNGYPEQITIFQERMVYGCNKQKPTTLWLSKTNDWEDFEAGSDDTSAMNYTMQTDKYDRIRWLLALKSGITLGTDYGEWQFGEANGGVVTVDNARYINTSSIGSATNIPAVVLGQALIMCKTGAEQLHRIDYNTLSEESAGTQLSLLSSHLFEDDPVYDMMVLRSPTNTMYCLHESGKLTSFTYEPEYDVAGWAQHPILDGVLAACVVRRSGVDIIAMIVKNGDEYVLGELNPQSEVYQDDGEDYTSTLIPTPLVSSQGGSAYGVKSVFAGVDVYVTEGTQFEVCLPGGSWHHVEVGYDTSNTLVPFDKPKVTVPAAAGWEDEPLIAIRSSYAAPLVITAVGAAIRRGK